MEFDGSDDVEEFDVIQRENMKPGQYLEFVAAGNDIVEPGLIFSRSNLKSIRQYVRHVYRLPSQADLIERCVGFSDLNIKVDDVLHFYNNLKLHAESWEVLENKTKDLGALLESFADEFSASGKDLIRLLEATEGYRQLTLKSESLQGLEVPHTPLGQNDKDIIYSSVTEYLRAVKTDVPTISRSVTDVKEGADNFSKQIGITLSPAVEKLNKSIVGGAVLEKLNKLREEISALDTKISEKDSEYSSYVGYSFIGSVFGPLGIVVTGGIYGWEAERVRAERAKLKAQRSKLSAQIEGFNPVLAELTSQHAELKELKFRLVDVEVAAKNFEDVWRILDSNIGSSESRLLAIDSDALLFKFVNDFKRVLAPWEKIGALSRNLSKMFNEPLDDIVEDV